MGFSSGHASGNPLHPPIMLPRVVCLFISGDRIPFVNGKHHTVIRVRYAETDKMGVAYTSLYRTWFEVGRTELLRDLGLTCEAMNATV